MPLRYSQIMKVNDLLSAAANNNNVRSIWHFVQKLCLCGNRMFLEVKFYFQRIAKYTGKESRTRSLFSCVVAPSFAAFVRKGQKGETKPTATTLKFKSENKVDSAQKVGYC